jgi:FkbM family methyltransferase
MKGLSELAPIVLFVYNRPWHTRQTLEALKNNILASESILYIYADGLKPQSSAGDLNKVAEVRRIIYSGNWCGEVKIIEREENWGLADNIIDGVTTIVKKHGKVIVLEDDIITSKGFLQYMNDALSFYSSEERVMHISGYMFPVKTKLPKTFFYNTASCWGWGTWDRAWKYLSNDAATLLDKILDKKLLSHFNIENSYSFENQLRANAEGRLKTWAVKWYASMFLKNGYALHPYPSLVNNIGHDGVGENCGVSSAFSWDVLAEKIRVDKIPIQESDLAKRAMIRFNQKIGQKINFKNKRQALAKFVLPNVVVDLIKRYKHINIKIFIEEHKLKRMARYTAGKTNVFGKPIKFTDSASFLFIYNEVFKKEIYRFSSNSQSPYIIDAGANIGLSVIYFKQLYPNAEIIAFEPDDLVYNILKYNINSFGYQNVKLIKTGLWDVDTKLRFFSEGADGGRIATSIDKEKLIEVQTERLLKYLNKRVDFLKIDIEGAEIRVLRDCQKNLGMVERIFVEYHSFADRNQELDELLLILKKAGFRYIIHHVGVFSPKPYLKVKKHMNMDLQLNIYGYKA